MGLQNEKNWFTRLKQFFREFLLDEPVENSTDDGASHSQRYQRTEVLDPDMFPWDDLIAPTPKALQTVLNDRYQLIFADTLQSCNYYRGIDLQQDQQAVLIKETFAKIGRVGSVQQSRPNISNILFYYDLFEQNGARYIVLNHPKVAWRPMMKYKLPQPLAQSLEWSLQIGHILRQLHPHFGKMPHGKKGYDALLVCGEQAMIADCSLLQETTARAVKEDVEFVAQLLFFLHTGQEYTESLLQLAHPQVRGIIAKANQNEYQTMQEFLRALQESEQAVFYHRLLRQSASVATHIGRRRDHNEDSVAKFDFVVDQSGKSEQTGLYIVADGMGGHDAGEVASMSTTTQAFSKFVEQHFLPQVRRQTQLLSAESAQNSHGQMLQRLVEEANTLVYQQNQQMHSDRGTTMVVALVVGEKVTIANVGDSRAYFWSKGELRQLTEDHSLVYKLYLANQITRDEIYTHPYKNRVLRSLGENAKVNVDIFTCSLQKGDKLLLCSDGLWEMVRDDQINTILSQTASPQSACDELIRIANQNGGEDNISVIIIHLE